MPKDDKKVISKPNHGPMRGTPEKAKDFKKASLAKFLEDNQKRHIVWLPDKKSSTEWKFWRRYQRYLMEEKGIPESSIIPCSRLACSD